MVVQRVADRTLIGISNTFYLSLTNTRKRYNINGKVTFDFKYQRSNQRRLSIYAKSRFSHDAFHLES